MVHLQIWCFPRGETGKGSVWLLEKSMLLWEIMCQGMKLLGTFGPGQKMWIWLRLSSTHWVGSLESFLLLFCPSPAITASFGVPKRIKVLFFTAACSYWKQRYFFKATLGPQQLKGKNKDLQRSLLHIHSLPISVPHQSGTLASTDDSTLEGHSLH